MLRYQSCFLPALIEEDDEPDGFVAITAGFVLLIRKSRLSAVNFKII